MHGDGGDPAGHSGLVVVCAAAPWDGVRLLDQHLALGLSRYAPVLYVDPPVPWPNDREPSTTLSGEVRPAVSSQPEIIGDRLTRLRPRVLPGHQRPVAKAVAIRMVRRSLRRAVRALGDPQVRAVIVPSLNRYFGACGEDLRVFYATDDFVAGADLMRLSPHRLRREMRRQPRDADLVVAASPALAETFRSAGHDPLLLPNGCDAASFTVTDEAEPPLDVHLPPPVAGYIGHLSSRIDVRFLDAVADRGHSLLLVGASPRGALPPELRRLVERENVAWIGPRPFEQLPSYLRLIDVGVVPYATSAFNQASFPLKALEYLAAGRPVVSTPIDAMRWLRDQHGPGADGPELGSDDFTIAGTPGEFAAAVGAALVSPRDPDAVDRRRAVARAHSWDRRFAALAGAIGLEGRTESSMAGTTS